MSETKNPAKNKFYVVAIGKIPGIYTNWEDTKEQIHGFSGDLYKSFTSM